MLTRVIVSLMIPAVALVLSAGTYAQTLTWNNPGTVPRRGAGGVRRGRLLAAT